MNWRFWHPSRTTLSTQDPAMGRVRMDGPCDHLWSDWSDPESVEVTWISWSGEQTSLDKLFQVRHCFACNRHERLVI